MNTQHASANRQPDGFKRGGLFQSPILRWNTLFALLTLLLAALAPRAEAAPWTPAYLPSTMNALWLDAADETTILRSGLSVTNWLDKSGNNRTFAQTVASNQPAYTPGGLNGLSVLSFTNSYLTSTNPRSTWTFLHDGTKVSMFSIVKVWTNSADTNVGAYGLWGTVQSSSQTGSYVCVDDRRSDRGNTNQIVHVVFGGSSQQSVINQKNNSWVTSQYRLLSLYSDPNASTASNRSIIRANGTTVSQVNTYTGTPKTGNPFDTLNIGSLGGGATRLVGAFAEIVFLTGAINDIDRQKMEGYLAWKWGLHGQLPAGHPYKDAAPTVTVPAPINIGGRLELFVDKHLVQSLSNATLRLHQPVDKGAVFSLDAPWEGNYSGYNSVVKDGDRFHLYNRGYRRLAAGTFAFPPVTSFRMSSDGITWEMPSVGLHSFNGSTDNSIIWTNNSLDMRSGYSECFVVSMNANPNALAQEKFIALAHREDSGTHSIFTSPDGATFTMKPNPVKVEPSDAGGDSVFWDTNLGQYAAYMRAWYNPTTGQALGYNGGPQYYRWVWRKLSPDLTNWSASVLMSFWDASGNPAPAEHYYTFSEEQYFRAPHLYIAMPSRFMATRRVVPEFYLDGVNDGVFLTSRDGVVWDRTFMEAFIRPGTDRLNWTSRAVYPVRGVVQTGTNELSVYWSERGGHGDVAPRIRRGTLRLDGFASVRAGAAGGEMITKPLTFTGSRLVLNHVTAPAGSVRVEIQDANGTPIPGYALANSTARTGDTLEETMSWTGGSDLSALAGTTIRLRFVLQDSDVYTMRFTN